MERVTWQKIWEYRSPDPSRQEFFSDPAIGDIDNDGVLDVVVIVGAGPTSMWGYPIALNGSDGTEKWRQSSVSIPPAPGGFEHPRSVALADMDGDGLLEVVCFTGSAVTYLNGANGSVKNTVYLYVNCPTQLVKPLVLDIDGDGSFEVIVQCNAKCEPYKPGTWCVGWNSVEWAFDVDNLPVIAPIHFSGPIAIDADGDELLEIFLQGGSQIVALDNDISLSPYWRRLSAPLGFTGKIWDVSCTPVMMPERQDTLFFPYEFTQNAVAVGELNFLFFLPILWRSNIMPFPGWQWATMTSWPGDVHKYCLYGVQMIGNGKGYAVGRGAMFFVRPRWKARLLETTDGGKTWTDVSERLPMGGYEPWPLLDIYFSDAKHGYIVGAKGWVYKTTDGGLTWTTPFQKPTPENLRGVYCYGGSYDTWNHIWVVGENGSIFYNDQGAGPWTSYSFIPPGYTSCDYEAAILDLWRQNPLLPPTPRERKDTVYIVGHGTKTDGFYKGLVLFTHDRVTTGWLMSEEGQGLWDINTHVDYSARRYLGGFEYIYSMAGNRIPSSPVYGDYFESGALILGLADNYPLAGGYTSGGRPFIVEKLYGSPEPTLEEPPPAESYEPQITTFFDPRSGYAFMDWPWDTYVLDVGYSVRVYPMGTTPSAWENPHLRNWHILEPQKTDSGYWDRFGVRTIYIVDSMVRYTQASDDLGDTSLFYHPGPAAVSDTLALFPSSTENLVVDYDGVAHLVYASRSLEDGEYHIYYIARPFGGAWSEPQDLGRGYAPTIALGNDNLTIHLAYTDVVGMTTDLYYRSKSPGGGWGAKVRLLKMTPGSGYIGIGAPALDVKGSVAHIAWKSGIKRGNPHKNCGYALLYGTLNTGNPRDFIYSELDRIEFQARDIDDYKSFVHHLAGVSAAVGRTTGTVHIVWDGDRDRMRVFQRKPGYGWVKCDLSITQYTTSEREPCLRVYRDGFYPSKIGVDTASIAEIAFVGDIGRSIAIFYAQVKEGVEVSSPIILDYTYSEFGRLSTPFLEEGYAVWSRKWSKPTEIRNEILARKIPKPGTTTPIEIVSLSPWVKSLNPEMVCYSWGASPQWLLLYTEYEERDGEAGLVKRSRDKRWEPRASYHFLGGENPAFITDYREGYIIYDDTLFEQGKASDTASERLIYTFYEVSDTVEYELGLVFYHQEPDTQALRVIIYSDTYAVYVPPYERYYWQMPVMSHSAITFSVEKQEAKRAFLSEAYLFPRGEDKGGPQSQGPEATAFSLSTYPSISKRGFSISISLPLRQEIDLSLYDVTGRLALSLAKGVYAPGSYEFRIEPHALSSGIYYLRLM
ncbi:MAG: FG-GAP-like repeat-containing protein, partial [candidate division WOR-3 bacterium]